MVSPAHYTTTGDTTTKGRCQLLLRLINTASKPSHSKAMPRQLASSQA